VFCALEEKLMIAKYTATKMHLYIIIILSYISVFFYYLNLYMAYT